MAQGRHQFAIKGFIGVCFPLNDGTYTPMDAIFYAQAYTRQCSEAGLGISGLETKQMHRVKHLPVIELKNGDFRVSHTEGEWLKTFSEMFSHFGIRDIQRAFGGPQYSTPLQRCACI